VLQHIIPSKTRRKILALFFTDISQTYHLRKISREVDEEINAVARELDILTKAKVVKRERRLNKMMFVLNPQYIFFDEFVRIFLKEGKLVQDLYHNQAKLGKIKFISISNKFALAEKISESEVYILFVGTLVSQEIAQIIKSAEKDYPFEINYTIMSEEEFLFRKKNSDPFLWTFLKAPQIVIFGSESEMRL
jgi:hypothetical protein